MSTAPPKDALLTAHKVQSGYGDTTIVFDANLRVDRGEVVTIIGPNGAGKSTLLKGLFGTLPIKNRPEGKIHFKGVDVSGWSPPQMVKHGAVFVPQTENIFTTLTIGENLELGGYTLGGGVKQRIEEIFEQFPELGARRKEKADNLSGGQRQSLAIARALMLKPNLVLLDEPSAALSPLAAAKVFERIVSIAGAESAVLMVEQNAEAALKVSHRGYVMVDGRTTLEDSAEAILNNPEIGSLFLGRVD